MKVISKGPNPSNNIFVPVMVRHFAMGNPIGANIVVITNICNKKCPRMLCHEQTIIKKLKKIQQLPEEHMRMPNEYMRLQGSRKQWGKGTIEACFKMTN